MGYGSGEWSSPGGDGGTNLLCPHKPLPVAFLQRLRPPRRSRAAAPPFLVLVLADLLLVLAVGLACGVAFVQDPARLLFPGIGALLIAVFVWERGGYAAPVGALADRIVPLGAGWLQAVAGLGLLTVLFGVDKALPAASDYVHVLLWWSAPMYFAVLALPPLAALRLAWPAMVRRTTRPRRTIVIGTGDAARLVVDRLRTAATEVELLGVVSEGGSAAPATFCGVPVLGAVDNLTNLTGSLQAWQADLVLIALPTSGILSVRGIAERLRMAPIDVAMVPDLAAAGCDGGAALTSLTGLSLEYVSVRPLAGRHGAIKRAEDIVLGSLLLGLASPVMLLIAVLVMLDSPGPVLFRQRRRGRGGHTFELLKFRTMHAQLGDPGALRQTSRGDARVTRIGRLLRRTSLDELPQFINVIGGSMSLVGPRPHALQTTIGGLPLETALPMYRARYRVKPGITGLAQVSGTRGELTSVEKLSRRVQFDLEVHRKLVAAARPADYLADDALSAG